MQMSIYTHIFLYIYIYIYIYIYRERERERGLTIVQKYRDGVSVHISDATISEATKGKRPQK